MATSIPPSVTLRTLRSAVNSALAQVDAKISTVQTAVSELTVAESENPQWPNADLWAVYPFYEDPGENRCAVWWRHPFVPQGGAVPGQLFGSAALVNFGTLFNGKYQGYLLNNTDPLPLAQWAMDTSRGGFAFCFWWKQLDFGTNNGVHEDCMFSQYTGDNLDSFIKVYRDRNTGRLRVRIVLDDGTGLETVSSRAVFLRHDEWVHIGVSYENGGTEYTWHEVTLVVNGGNVSSIGIGNVRTANPNPTAPQMFGASGSATPDLCSDGIISQFVVWNAPKYWNTFSQLYNDGKGIEYHPAE